MKVKILSRWKQGGLPDYMEWQGVEFTRDPDCRDYDWLVVYDELPRSLKYEELACPREHTILVNIEPQIIKVQPPVYTRQFNYILTTVDPGIIRHPHYRRSCGALVWLSGHTLAEAAEYPEFEKTDLVSAVCTRKLMKRTDHYLRHRLFEYLLEHLDGFVWRGQGINPVECKKEVMDSFKYTVAVENVVQPWHWTEKVSDAIISQCLMFYSGDPELGKVLPPGCFIPIPVDNPPEALRIIQEAIANNEYEKRLPAIRMARRLIVERYNFFEQVLDVIAGHERMGEPDSAPGGRIYERHALRHNPWNVLTEYCFLARVFFARKYKLGRYFGLS